MLYKANEKGKDKFISFQLHWHNYGAIFLLPKDTPIQCMFSLPTRNIYTVCELWLKFFESAWDEHKNVMISFSSIIYDTLLDEVHTEILRMKEPTPATGTAQSTASSISDQYVYYQFGGGILASMLHN